MITFGIYLVCGVALAVAAYVQDLAAIYVAFFSMFILGALHSIDIKLDRLLNQHEVTTSKDDIHHS